MLTREFVKITFICLSDEVTGYQYKREKNELQALLKAFIFPTSISSKSKDEPLELVKENGTRPITKSEFDKILQALLKVPPPEDEK